MPNYCWINLDTCRYEVALEPGLPGTGSFTTKQGVTATYRQSLLHCTTGAAWLNPRGLHAHNQSRHFVEGKVITSYTRVVLACLK